MQVSVVAPMRLLFLATALIACACSAQRAPEAPAAPARAPDRFIYVSTGEVPSVCYHDLGGVTFTEPFTSAAMDGDGVQMATKLRAMAMEKYPDEADAVINVQTEQNSIGTIVTVKGEVVELQHGQTVECAMRKAPGVINTAAAIAAGGMLGAVAGGLVAGSATGAMVGGAVGVGAVGTYLGVNQHLQTEHEQAHLRACWPRSKPRSRSCWQNARACRSARPMKSRSRTARSTTRSRPRTIPQRPRTLLLMRRSSRNSSFRSKSRNSGATSRSCGIRLLSCRSNWAATQPKRRSSPAD